MKFLDQTGLTELVTKIKAWGRSSFFQKAESEPSRVLSIDTTPTASSENLVSSGGVKAALDTKENTISDLSTIRTNASTGATHAASAHARTDATAVSSSSTNGNIKINGTETTVYTHPGSGTNPHGTTASDVGLGSVVNTGDSATPVSGGTTKFTTGGAYTELAKKQNTLANQTAYNAVGSATKVPQITTNNLGQVTGITEIDISQSTVNNASLTMQINGTTKTIFYANDATDKSFNVTAADLGLTGTMKFVGVSTTDPKGATGATVAGHTTWAKGEVVIYKRGTASGYEEYVNIDGNNTSASWELLGDADSYVIKGTETSQIAPDTNYNGEHTHTVTIPKVTTTASKLDLISVTPAVSNGQATKTVFGTATTASKVSVASVTASKATAGTAMTIGNANAGGAVTVATGLTGTTSFNTDAIKTASLTGTTSFNTDGVKVSYNSTTKCLEFTSAASASVGITTTAASKASVTASTTSITPAVASTTTFTPYTFADVTVSSVSATDVSVPVVSSNDTVDVAKAGTAITVADGSVSASGTGSDIVTAVSVTTETSGASSAAGSHKHVVEAHTHTVG